MIVQAWMWPIIILAFLSVMPFLLGYWIKSPKWVQFGGLILFTVIVIFFLVWGATHSEIVLPPQDPIPTFPE